ncbi:MAG: hypothetical protein AAF502_11295 [Bacteroidota bacterium]
MRNLLIFCLFAVVMIFSYDANATVFRVNNTGVTGVDVYDNFTDAHDAAVVGDTIYIEGSAASYGNLSISKQLYVFGSGYNLNVNTGLQAFANASICGQIILQAGSAGSKISGLTLTNYLYIRDQDMVIERNQINRTIFLGDGATQNVSNCVIKQNFLFNGYNNAGISYSASAQRGNILIANNIIQTPISLTGSGASGIIINNTFRFDSNSWSLNADGFSIINNISANGNVTINAGNSFFNNIGNSTQYPAGNGNQQNVPGGDVFTLETGSVDNDTYYQTAPGSVAEGTGQSGEDCGAFGGGTAYVLSGIPSIPTIYEFVAPATGTNSINVIISTRSNQ